MRTVALGRSTRSTGLAGAWLKRTAQVKRADRALRARRTVEMERWRMEAIQSSMRGGVMSVRVRWASASRKLTNLARSWRYAVM